MPSKADYRTLEQEYVTSNVSIRAIAAKYNVAFSAVAKKARELDWNKKRAEYQSQARDKALMSAMERIADDAAEIKVEAVTAMRATIYSYIDNLKSGQVTVGTKEAALAIDKLMLLLGEATERKETHVTIDDSLRNADTAELQQLLALVRARVVDGRAARLGDGDPPPFS